MHASRSARQGDQLVTAMLLGHTIGLVSPEKPDVAVCLLPGSRLKVQGVVPDHLAAQYHISPGDHAVFGQSEESPDYRDGMSFEIHPDRPLILFQDLLEGVHFEVVSIPVSEPVVKEPERARELELA